MPFGRKADSSRIMVYEYGCLPPVKGGEAMVEAMRRRNELWNRFVEIERAHREKVRAILPPLPGQEEIDRVKADLDTVRQEIKNARKAARKGSVNVSALRALAEELKARLVDLIAAKKVEKEERKAIIDAHRDDLARLDEERIAAVKQAQAESGLWWCNYEDVFVAYDAARKRTIGKGIDLKFHQWDGTGKVTVRYQQGLLAAEVFGDDTRFQIDPVAPEAWSSPIRAVRRKAAETNARLRVGSHLDRSPLWVMLPIVMHRPLPTGSVIRSAAVVRECTGGQFRHKLIVTVALADAPTPRSSGIACGVDLRWGRVHVGPKTPGAVMLDLQWYDEGKCPDTDGLRVAYWRDEEGRRGQLVLSDSLLQQFAKLDDLRAIRDEKFNHVKADLAAWLKAFKAHADAPKGLLTEAATLPALRAKSRLEDLARRWEKSRFDGDSEIVPVLANWLRREIHLSRYEAGLRDQLLRHRREIYRQFAAWLASEYWGVSLEDFDLRSVAEKPEAEEGTNNNTVIGGGQRFIASPHSLRLAIEQVCGREGVRTCRTPTEYTTRECHVCGHRGAFDTGRQMMQHCPACNALWDKGYNAATNILRRGLEQMRDQDLEDRRGSVADAVSSE